MGRGTEILRSLCKAILKDNRLAGRLRLRGGLHVRDAACAKVSDILALTELNSGKEWSGHSTDRLIRDIRATAGDVRASATLRAQSCARLAVILGYLPMSDLGDSPLDDLIRRHMTPKSPERVEVEPTVVPQQTESFEDQLARLTKEFEEGTR
jgi:hypothetical protein